MLTTCYEEFDSMVQSFIFIYSKKIELMKTHFGFISASFLTFLLLYFSNSAFSQSLNWIKQIQGSGSDYIKSMTTDASGNIYVVGAFTGILDFDPGASVVNAGPAVGSDIWFGKYNSTGSLVWAKALIGGDDDFGRDIVLDNSGNIYITGYFATQFPLDFDPGAGTAPPSVPKGLFFAKYNNSGAFQWVKTIGATSANGVRSHAIALDASGNCYLAGQMSSSQATSYDFDPGAGVSNLSTANGSVFYAKYTSLGNYVWAKNVGPANTGGEATDLSLDASGNVHITGSFVGNADFHPSSTAPVLNSANGGAFVCKYNSSGNYVWSTQVTGGNGDRGMALVTDATNNVFVTEIGRASCRERVLQVV